MAIALKTKAAVFLYGAPNIAGSSAALAGLGMFFAGVFSDWWLPICAGLYAAGFLVMPASRGLAAQAEAAATSESLSLGLSRLIEQSRSRLPAEAVALLGRIEGVVDGLAPKMFDGSMAMEHAVVMSNAVTRDLPATVGNYLRLPTAFANLHALEGGKTCKAMLVEQLALLEEQLAGMAESAHRNDAEAVKINGMLLRDKFKPVAFLD